MSEPAQGPHHPRLDPRRWRARWVARERADVGSVRATVRSRVIVACHHPDRVGPADQLTGPRGTGREQRIAWITRWFLTHDAYEAWRDAQPIRVQVNSDLYTHVGHGPFTYLPSHCTACALTQKMMDSLP